MVEIQIFQMIGNREYKNLKEFLESVHPADLAEILQSFDDKYIVTTESHHLHVQGK